MQRVLIVDDTETIRRGLTLLVRSHGLDAVSVNGGDEALDYLEKSRPDLIVLDLSMPDTDGLMVLEQMREWPDLDGVPVLVYTAVCDDATRRQAMKLGATDFVEKGSVDWDELAGRILRQLNGGTLLGGQTEAGGTQLPA